MHVIGCTGTIALFMSCCCKQINMHVIGCRGRIEQQGTPREILDAPATPFVMNFIADVNQIPSTCQVLHLLYFSMGRLHADSCSPKVPLLNLVLY